MRDHTKLKAFASADEFVLDLYRITKSWPSDEKFGLTSQVRRASISVASNLVEGSSHSTQREYLRFIEISYGSAREVAYQLSLARRLDFPVGDLESKIDFCCRMLAGLIRKMGTEQ